MQKSVLIAVVVIALTIIAWAMWPAREQAVPEPQPVEPPPTPELTAPEPLDPTPVETPPDLEPAPEVERAPEAELPPLAESDPFVRERLEPLDLPQPWVEQGDYVRRLAVVMENATRGTYPRRQLAFLAPQGAFEVIERGETVYVDSVSYDRYDRYVDEVTSIEPARLAGLLETLNPLIETALAELGVEAPPGQTFATAVQAVLAVPVLEGDVELVRPNVMYRYADPDLESLSPLKKQVLRMGPENVERLQGYLRRLAAEMELEL